MITKKDLEKIKEIINEFFLKMTVSVEVEVGNLHEKTLPVNLKTENPQFLIGEKGQTLVEIQRLLKLIVRKKVDKDFYVDLDINGYKKNKIEHLKQLARSMANEVALNKKEVILPAMSAYERRVIHLELADRENIATESIGQEPERKIIIKPYP